MLKTMKAIYPPATENRPIETKVLCMGDDMEEAKLTIIHDMIKCACRTASYYVLSIGDDGESKCIFNVSVHEAKAS